MSLALSWKTNLFKRIPWDVLLASALAAAMLVMISGYSFVIFGVIYLCLCTYIVAETIGLELD